MKCCSTSRACHLSTFAVDVRPAPSKYASTSRTASSSSRIRVCLSAMTSALSVRNRTRRRRACKRHGFDTLSAPVAPTHPRKELTVIYEIRTYEIGPGNLAEVEKRYGEAYEYRKKYSPLTAFWHTEIGPLNRSEERRVGKEWRARW